MEPRNSQNTLKARNLGNRPGSPERCGLRGPQRLVLPRISRISRFELQSCVSGVFTLSPAGRFSPFLRQTCLFLFFCESQDIGHKYITITTFLRGAILLWPVLTPPFPSPLMVPHLHRALRAFGGLGSRGSPGCDRSDRANTLQRCSRNVVKDAPPSGSVRTRCS